MPEYRHIVIDKTNVGLNVLREQVATYGLETAQQRKITLAQGSIKLEHHLHVFLWDETAKGHKGVTGLTSPTSFLVRVRWRDLVEPGVFSQGTLRGDGGHFGPPAGRSDNGAWAFKGSIPRKYCFIEGWDRPDHRGFNGWRDGTGWAPVPKVKVD